MNNFDDVYALNRDERQISNLETYRRFISKGDKPLECINDEDAKAIKDALSGKGRVLAVADGRRSLAGNHKYVLFVKEDGGVKVYLYTVLNGLYNEMGPYKDLDTAMSNADCYGLFEECKKVASTKVLENNMNKKLFEEITDKRPLREAYSDEFVVLIGLKGPDGVTYDQISYADGETDIDYEEGTYGYDSDIRNNVFPMTRAEATALAAEIVENAPAGDVMVGVVPYSTIPNDSTGETMEESIARARNQLRKVQERVLAKAKNHKLCENEDFDDDIMTFDGDEMEDWSWDDYDDDFGGKTPNQEMEDHLADCFPTRDSEYQDDEGDYDPFSYVQMGDGSGGIGKRTKTAAYASNLKGGDYAPTFDDGTVLGGNFDNDDNSDFAMSDDADLDAWAREA